MEDEDGVRVGAEDVEEYVVVVVVEDEEEEEEELSPFPFCDAKSKPACCV